MSHNIKSVPGEPLRFWVASDTLGTAPYLVDLGELGGNGECACLHFQCRLVKQIREEGASERTRCKHIRRARDYLLDGIIATYAKGQTETRKPQHDLG